MSWYYAEDGKQRGPVQENELEDLVKAGTVKSDTLVWREGMANWQPYGQAKGGVPEAVAAAPAAVVPEDGVVCSQCSKLFSRDEVIRYGDLWVCAACKPIFLQRLREGAALTSGVAAIVTQEELLARDYDVDVGGYFSKAWALFKANAGIIIGASVLVYLVLMAINFVPYLSFVLALILTGPLMGGLWMFYVKHVRGESAGVGDAFGGFGPRFVQLMLASIVSTVLSYLCIVPAAFVFGAGVAASAVGHRAGAADLSAVTPALLIVGGLVALAGVLGLVYLSVSWVFAFPLVADKQLNFWPAMQLSRKTVGKHWWMTFWLMFVSGLFAGLGALLCLVGILVTAPVSFAMLAHHYQKVFGDLAPATQQQV